MNKMMDMDRNTRARYTRPATAMPMALETHITLAVVKPLTLTPSLKLHPLPGNQHLQYKKQYVLLHYLAVLH